MAKKSKRQTRKVSGTKRTDTNFTAIENSTRASDRGFNPDYSYVFKDLKRIGMLAGSFFVVLIVIAFFLR